MDFEKLIYLDHIKFYQWSSKDNIFVLARMKALG